MSLKVSKASFVSNFHVSVIVSKAFLAQIVSLPLVIDCQNRKIITKIVAHLMIFILG